MHPPFQDSPTTRDRKSTRLNFSHPSISYAVFCLKKKNRTRDARIMILSEYVITTVSRPVHLNRELLKHGMVSVRQELGRELLDAGASVYFDVAAPQETHVLSLHDALPI